ncbi:MAG: metallophosphoesterase family protein [Flavobacteriaceae bacterium]|nr:metallophosphoesterase family protein [Flavobacteriaceae bacterium]
MKKILLLSDTHGYIDDQILNHVKQADETWHAGDIGNISVTDTLKKHGTLRAVFGNIDDHIIRKEFPLDEKFTIENTKVWMTHIGGYPNRYDKRIKHDLAIHRPAIFISGHSHILKVIFDKKLNILHLNPGAVGKHGFHNVRTMIRFKIDLDRIYDLEIIELEQRN